MPKVDPKLFNTDPKHEQDRATFDEMVEGSIGRVIAKKKKENPDEEISFGDILDNIFGGSKK